MLHNPDSRISPNRRIAVVGSGVAGLSAAWLLSQRHDVTLYEKSDRLGGHANTVDVDTPHGRIGVDTGFIVYNPANYPNFSALLDHLNVASVRSEMSFAVSLGQGKFEYSSNFRGVLGQKRNLFNPSFWRFLKDLTRFYGHAESMLGNPAIDSLTLGEFLDHHNYSPMLIDHHILPMCAAIWSSEAKDIRNFPMPAFVRFFASHNLFAIGGRELWCTVKGGSRTYINALIRDFSGQVRLGADVIHIRREHGLVFVEEANGHSEVFGDVVIATHADEALALLDDADAGERSFLGAFKYTQNTAVLHDDVSLMPKRKTVWANWNYIGSNELENDKALCVSYWMNSLQSLDRRYPLIVTLNPAREPRSQRINRTFSYAHPLFDRAALDAQRQLWSLQGQRNTWFCGSYFGYGFHEDALQSGLAVAERFGVRRPWTVAEESARIMLGPLMSMAAE